MIADKTPTIATICSHSALQIFHGAREENMPTLGICTKDRLDLYSSFPKAVPDDFLVIDEFPQVLEANIQSKLTAQNSIVVPHGSFVEYVGPQKLINDFSPPIFGNKHTLEWESDRIKERKWLERSGIRIPKEYENPADIDRTVIVKFSGAKGGRGFFLANSQEEFQSKISGRENEEYTIQEWAMGTRYYPHYFYSPLRGRLEILGFDRRDESNIDEYYRVNQGEKSFVVVGNKPLAVRESLLPQLYKMGNNLIKSSQQLFGPGLFGPFCLETVCTDKLEFITFEISGRIVAGTNLYPQGSPYSFYYYDEPMSTGKRIAREIKTAFEQGQLENITT